MAKTEKQKFLELAQYCDRGIEEMVFLYLKTYPEDFSASRLNWFIKQLQEYPLMHRIEQLELTRYVAFEKATYLETYLEGKMYTNEEAARQAIPVQLKNARDILKACKGEEVK